MFKFCESQSKKLNFLSWPDLAFSSSTHRDLGTRLPHNVQVGEAVLDCHLKGDGELGTERPGDRDVGMQDMGMWDLWKGERRDAGYRDAGSWRCRRRGTCGDVQM